MGCCPFANHHFQMGVIVMGFAEDLNIPFISLSLTHNCKHVNSLVVVNQIVWESMSIFDDILQKIFNVNSITPLKPGIPGTSSIKWVRKEKTSFFRYFRISFEKVDALRGSKKWWPTDQHTEKGAFTNSVNKFTVKIVHLLLKVFSWI